MYKTPENEHREIGRLGGAKVVQLGNLKGRPLGRILIIPDVEEKEHQESGLVETWTARRGTTMQARRGDYL